MKYCVLSAGVEPLLFWVTFGAFVFCLTLCILSIKLGKKKS